MCDILNKKTTQNSKKKIVVKFGGSNLKRKEDIEKIVSVVKYYDQPLVIVISALYGVTDTLVKGLREIKLDKNGIGILKNKLEFLYFEILDLYVEDTKICEETKNIVRARLMELEKYLLGVYFLGDVPDFVKDQILSYGERLSSGVFSAILKDNNMACKECLPEELGLITNGEYGNASVDFGISEKQVLEHLGGDEIVVVPGFYGISQEGRVTVFGRGGSDYTAAAIARCINASWVDFWKDVQGFMSADPKLVENAKVIHRLTYNEAAELSYFGARILHPRTFEPVQERNIGIRLFNIHDFSKDLEPVTVIGEKGYKRGDVIKSVTWSDDFGVLRLHGVGVGIKPGIMAGVTHTLSERGINIKSIITAQTSINILLSSEDIETGLKQVKTMELMAVDGIEAIGNISLIAVVGEGILEKPGIAARMFTAVSAHGINIRMISAGASNEAIYFIIDKEECAKAIVSIHEEFFGNPEMEFTNAGLSNFIN